jgi:hypothetical protein
MADSTAQLKTDSTSWAMLSTETLSPALAKSADVRCGSIYPEAYFDSFYLTPVPGRF